MKIFFKEFVKPFPSVILQVGCHLAGYSNHLQSFCLSNLGNGNTFVLFFSVENCFHQVFLNTFDFQLLLWTFCPAPQQAGSAAGAGHRLQSRMSAGENNANLSSSSEGRSRMGGQVPSEFPLEPLLVEGDVFTHCRKSTV